MIQVYGSKQCLKKEKLKILGKCSHRCILVTKMPAK